MKTRSRWLASFGAAGMTVMAGCANPLAMDDAEDTQTLRVAMWPPKAKLVGRESTATGWSLVRRGSAGSLTATIATSAPVRRKYERAARLAVRRRQRDLLVLDHVRHGDGPDRVGGVPGLLSHGRHTVRRRAAQDCERVPEQRLGDRPGGSGVRRHRAERLRHGAFQLGGAQRLVPAGQSPHRLRLGPAGAEERHRGPAGEVGPVRAANCQGLLRGPRVDQRIPVPARKRADRWRVASSYHMEGRAVDISTRAIIGAAGIPYARMTRISRSNLKSCI